MLCPRCYVLVPLGSHACPRCQYQIVPEGEPSRAHLPEPPADKESGHPSARTLPDGERAALLDATLARMALEDWSVVRRRGARAEVAKSGGRKRLYVEILRDGSVLYEQEVSRRRRLLRRLWRLITGRRGRDRRSQGEPSAAAPNPGSASTRQPRGP